MTFRLTLLPVIMLALAGCDYLPFSSGELDGEVATPPADWTSVGVPKVIELETRPSDPYSVKLWAIGLGPVVYVHAGASRTNWVEHIEADPRVRLGIDDTIYELTAVQVKGDGEFQQFAAAYDTKYGNRPRNENIDEIYLYRLSPRSEPQ